jgi:hypothetical protein
VYVLDSFVVQLNALKPKYSSSWSVPLMIDYLVSWVENLKAKKLSTSISDNSSGWSQINLANLSAYDILSSDIRNWITLIPNNNWWEDIVIKQSSWSWYVIMDRNLWATAAYNWEEESTDVSVKIEDWRGYHYQWWRDVWFAIATWALNSSQARISASNRNTNTNFIWDPSYSVHDWSITQEDHLWWDTSTLTWSINGSKQWPCPIWYHVPSTDEWNWLIRTWFANNWGSCTTDISWSYCSFDWRATLYGFKKDLKLPFAGRLFYYWSNLGGEGRYGQYWSSSPSVYTGEYARLMNFDYSKIYPQSNVDRSTGLSIRCFKD